MDRLLTSSWGRPFLLCNLPSFGRPMRLSGGYMKIIFWHQPPVEPLDYKTISLLPAGQVYEREKKSLPDKQMVSSPGIGFLSFENEFSPAKVSSFPHRLIHSWWQMFDCWWINPVSGWRLLPQHSSKGIVLSGLNFINNYLLYQPDGQFHRRMCEPGCGSYLLGHLFLLRRRSIIWCPRRRHWQPLH